jgi:chemotaxis protein methyltransferase CheR
LSLAATLPNTMPFSTDTLGLPDTGFALLRDLIHERTGLFYGEGKNDILTDRLSPLVIERGFNSFLDYYYLLKYDPEAGSDWRRVVDALSVQETYFWREIDQIRAVVDVLVPQHFSQPRGQALRIWSAACATGEEPLTLAMALSEAGWFERAPIEIYASDASASAIDKARRGVYRERSFQRLQPALREKYFFQEDSRWRVQPQLRSRIRWSVANLVLESDVAQLATASIILCRNVFIYFSPESISRTLKVFSRLMPHPGHLFVGASESLLKLTTDFAFQEIGGAFVYVKT